MSEKILIAYFSASGVTAGAADKMSKAIEADLYEIRPEQPYTSADLDWTNKKSRSTVEMTDPACRPAIADPLKSIDGYDVILLGFPVWWGVEPRIVDTFLEGFDFAGKVIVPFATSGGSGITTAEKSLKEHCPAAVWKKGQIVNGSTAADWAKRVVEG